MKKRAFTWLLILAMFVSVFAGVNLTVSADGAQRVAYMFDIVSGSDIYSSAGNYKSVSVLKLQKPTINAGGTTYSDTVAITNPNDFDVKVKLQLCIGWAFNEGTQVYGWAHNEIGGILKHLDVPAGQTVKFNFTNIPAEYNNTWGTGEWTIRVADGGFFYKVGATYTADTTAKLIIEDVDMATSFSIENKGIGSNGEIFEYADLSIRANKADRGTVSASENIEYVKADREVIFVTATPNIGCSFAGWYIDGELFSTNAQEALPITGGKLDAVAEFTTEVNGLVWHSAIGGNSVKSIVVDEKTGDKCYSFSPVGQYYSAGLYLFDAIKDAVGEDGTGRFVISVTYRGIVDPNAATPTCNSFRARRDNDGAGANRLGDISGVKFDGDWHTVSKTFDIENWVVSGKSEAINEKEFLCFGTVTNASSLTEVRFKDTAITKAYTEADINGLEWKSTTGSTVRTVARDELTGEACYSFSPIGQYSSAGLYVYDAIKDALGENGTGAVEISFKYRGTVKADSAAPTCNSFRARRDNDSSGLNRMGDIGGVKFDGAWHTATAVFKLNNWVVQGRSEAIGEKEYLCFGTITNAASLQAVYFKDTSVRKILSESDVNGLEWQVSKSASGTAREIKIDDITGDVCYSFTNIGQYYSASLYMYDAIKDVVGDSGTGTVYIKLAYCVIPKTDSADVPSCNGFRSRRDGDSAGINRMGDIKGLKLDGIWHEAVAVLDIENWVFSDKTEAINDKEYICFGTITNASSIAEVRFKDATITNYNTDELIDGLKWQSSGHGEQLTVESDANHDVYYHVTDVTASYTFPQCDILPAMQEMYASGASAARVTFDYRANIIKTGSVGSAIIRAAASDFASYSGNMFRNDSGNILLNNEYQMHNRPFEDDDWHTAEIIIPLSDDEFSGGMTKWGLCLSGLFTESGTINQYVESFDIKGVHTEPFGLRGANLEIGSSIAMNFYADAAEYATLSMKFFRNGTELTADETAEAGNVIISGEIKKLAKLTCEDIYPQHMGDTVTAELYVNGYRFTSCEYSVLEYCDAMYQKYSSDSAFIKLLSDMLVYGAEAQKYVGRSELVTSAAAWVEANKTAVYNAPAYTADTSAHGDIYSASLELGDTVRLLFKVKNGTAVSGLYKNGTLVPYTVADDGQYTRVYSSDIPISQLADKYTLELADGSYVTYSAYDYISRKGASNALAKALYNYARSAADYEPDEITVNLMAQTWKATEITFVSGKSYASPEKAFDVMQDVVFTNKVTGTTLTIPAFWNGDNVWCVRFAPTEKGVWEYMTKCPQDETLDGLTGTVGATEYTGNLDIYKHGFVTSSYGQKYFTYADGTPFFYLGDTHWTMLSEEFDSAGDHAGTLDTDSHFKYIVDRRVSQGFTVYQSEPLGGKFRLYDASFDMYDLEGLQEADNYFAYIAEKGMVHANAMLFFVNNLTAELAQNEAYLEKISRYWVARFGAYPVMWTLAQEVDNDCYAENDAEPDWDHTDNPWLKVAEYVHKYDAYAHPLTGHQEGATNTTVTGRGITVADASNNGASIFLSDEVTARTGHDWFAAQWKPNLASNETAYTEMAKDYWESSKIAVNYEGRYVYLWTDNFGGRVQGWLSYLNGFYGYGYGCQDIWYYKSDYDMDAPSVRIDGRSTVTVADKQKYWSETVNAGSSSQCGFMKNFFSQIEWWKLVPDFDSNAHFIPETGTLSACAASDDAIVIYSYRENTKFGTVCGLDVNATYTARWFNTRMGAFDDSRTVTIENVSSYKFTAKPDSNDWALLITKN